MATLSVLPQLDLGINQGNFTLPAGLKKYKERQRELERRRNEIERLFRRLKGFRRIFSRFEKLDVLFLGFILFVLIVDALR